MYDLTSKQLAELNQKILQSAYEWFTHPDRVPEGVTLNVVMGESQNPSSARKRACLEAAASYHAPRFEFEVLECVGDQFEIAILGEKRRN